MDISAPASARVRKAAKARRAAQDEWDFLGELRLPDMRLRDVRLPDMRMPDLRLPRIPDVSEARARIGDAATDLHARATLAVSLVREAVGR
jgi:hypothetical protein